MSWRVLWPFPSHGAACNLKHTQCMDDHSLLPRCLRRPKEAMSTNLQHRLMNSPTKLLLFWGGTYCIWYTGHQWSYKIGQFLGIGHPFWGTFGVDHSESSPNGGFYSKQKCWRIGRWWGIKPWMCGEDYVVSSHCNGAILRMSYAAINSRGMGDSGVYNQKWLVETDDL